MRAFFNGDDGSGVKIMAAAILSADGRPAVPD
jgi:hypothetical protein